MSYDEIIPLLGDFGRYQKRIYFLLCLPAILCAFHKLGTVFLVADPDYRCMLPGEPPNASFILTNETMKAMIPWDKRNNKLSSCEYLDGNETKSCEGYIFDHSVYGHTAVIEWQLTCKRAYLIASGNSLFMFGVMVGSIVFGELSDRYGRKLIFFISLIIQLVFGTLGAIAPEFWSFSISRFVVGATTSGVFLVAYVIALEMVGPSMRTLAGTVIHMFFSFGYMLTAALAFYIPEWRSLQLALTLPGLIFICYWFIIPESTRWLVAKNRITEAKKLVQRAAKVNNVTISDEVLNTHLVPEEKPAVDLKQASVLDIFKYPNLRKRSLIIFFDWFANNITYYGLSWNTNNLSGDPYWNFVISGLVEIPAYSFVLLTLNRWGRKFVMCGCMIVAGIALLFTAIPQNPQWLVITLAMLGKLSITASYGAVYIFSTEQFPTVIRNAGLGAGSTCARLGSIIAPFFNILSKIWIPMPLIIYGLLAFTGGVLSLTLPETLNKQLPETIEEGEAFGK
ncbi:organic cation transporter protein isoform X2 [Aethina tumida]|nr:organic cation transporter protein isoform X2 [Aethina tumida]